MNVHDTVLYVNPDNTKQNIHTKTRERVRVRPNGEVKVIKVSKQEMRRLWK